MFNALLCLYLKEFLVLVFWGVNNVVKCRACARVEDLLKHEAKLLKKYKNSTKGYAMDETISSYGMLRKLIMPKIQ